MSPLNHLLPLKFSFQWFHNPESKRFSTKHYLTFLFRGPLRKARVLTPSISVLQVSSHSSTEDTFLDRKIFLLRKTILNRFKLLSAVSDDIPSPSRATILYFRGLPKVLFVSEKCTLYLSAVKRIERTIVV
ncbi:hypothetical protein GOODEAATRI_032653 [Goodea atripinnis]|uniref:Maturase K n=1 Tax=Goodea atripinnis TaxID=208336 RepID=A0ABV0Q2X3_9TELE